MIMHVLSEHATKVFRRFVHFNIYNFIGQLVKLHPAEEYCIIQKIQKKILHKPFGEIWQNKNKKLPKVCQKFYQKPTDVCLHLMSLLLILHGSFPFPFFIFFPIL